MIIYSDRFWVVLLQKRSFCCVQKCSNCPRLQKTYMYILWFFALTVHCPILSQIAASELSDSTQLPAKQITPSQRTIPQLDYYLTAKITHIYSGHAQSRNPICPNSSPSCPGLWYEIMDPLLPIIDLVIIIGNKDVMTDVIMSSNRIITDVIMSNNNDNNEEKQVIMM